MLPLRLLVPIAAVCIITTTRAQQPTFSSRVEGVRVDVLVTERGKPVLGLQPADFEVRDNGVLQRVDVVSFGQVPLSVILALDHSDSVIGERLEQLRRASGALLDGLRGEDQAALLTFSDVVAERAPLTRDVKTVREALRETEATGPTSLFDASYAGIVVGESDVGRSLLMIFSDGIDTSSWLRLDQVLESARRADVVVYAVTIGARRSAFLRAITESTGGSLFEANDATKLRDAFLKVLDEFRHRYLITFSPTGVAKTGWHQLQVRVKRPNTRVSARAGYQAGS